MTDSKSPLKASFLKIRRAQQHIRELETVVAEYMADEPLTIGPPLPDQQLAEPPPGMEVLFRVSWSQQTKAVPPIVSAILGDIFHNLRSALDLMAAALVRAKGEDDSDVYFPFAKTEDELQYRIERCDFEKAGPEAVELLKRMKPFRGGNVPLREIHDLNIRDKHRMLIEQHMTISGPIIDTRPPGGGLLLLPDTASVKLIFPAYSVLAGKELIPTLNDLVELVTGVLKAFQPLVTPAVNDPRGEQIVTAGIGWTDASQDSGHISGPSEGNTGDCGTGGSGNQETRPVTPLEAND